MNNCHMESSQIHQHIRRQILMTSRAKTCFRKGFKFGERLKCHPYVWEDDEDYPIFSTSQPRILGWVLNIVLTVSHLIFLLVRCTTVCSSPVQHTSSKALVLFLVIYCLLPVVFHATLLMARDQLPDFVRSSFSYCQKFEESYVRETAKKSRAANLCEIFLACMLFSLKLNVLLMTAYSLARLNGPELVSSMIPGYPVLQITVNMAFYSYFYSTFSANSYVMGFSAIGMVFPFIDIANILGKTVSSLTNEKLQRPQDRIRVYRVLQLQANAIDRVFWFVIASAKYSLMLIAMFCTYGAIRIPGLVGHVLGALGVSCTLILVVLLSAFAEFYSGSSDALKSLRTMTARPDVLANGKLRAWLQKSVRSLQLARIPVGGTYYIDKELVLSAVGIIVNGIIFLLVNF